SPMDWDSEMLLRLEQARIRSAQENISVQAGLRWHMSTELDTADDLLFDNRLQFRDVDIHPLQGTMPAPFRLDDTALHIRLSGIATAPLADFITRLQALVRYMEVQYGSEGRYGNGRLQAFMERRLPQLLPELLSDRTRLLIEIPSFDSNQGALEFRLAAAINEQVTNNSSLPQWLQLLQQLEVTLDAAIDQSLVAYLPGHNMPLLRQLANERWLEHKEQRFCTSAELQNMQLHINGRSASGLLRQPLRRNSCVAACPPAFPPALTSYARPPTVLLQQPPQPHRRPPWRKCSRPSSRARSPVKNTAKSTAATRFS